MPERRSLQLSNALRDVLPEQLERPLPSSPVLQSHGLTTHIPDAVHTGLRAVCLFETLDSTEEVTAWLHLLDLDRYCSTFIEHGITGRVLLGLNARELRDSLGVMRLKDRRTLIDGIRYLEERLIGGGKSGYPEDGRILTHLSNERLLLLWIRYSIVAQTVAIAILFLLGDIPVGKVSRKIVAASFAFIAGGVCAQLVSHTVYSGFHGTSFLLL